MTAEGRMSGVHSVGAATVFLALAVSRCSRLHGMSIRTRIGVGHFWRCSCFYLAGFFWVRGMVQPEVSYDGVVKPGLTGHVGAHPRLHGDEHCPRCAALVCGGCYQCGREAGDEERIQELTTAGQGESRLADRVVYLFRPAPGSKERRVGRTFNLPTPQNGNESLLGETRGLLAVAFFLVIFGFAYRETCLLFGSIILGLAFLGPKMTPRPKLQAAKSESSWLCPQH